LQLIVKNKDRHEFFFQRQLFLCWQ